MKIDKTIFTQSPIYPLPPFFGDYHLLGVQSFKDYINFLTINNAKVLMTTEGTTSFDLLSSGEISVFNKTLSDNFPHACILGLPRLGLEKLLEQIKWYNENIINDKAALMLLFPERFYSDNQVVDFFAEAAEESNLPVFIHGRQLTRAVGAPFYPTAALMNKIYDASPNIIGMKEEEKSLDNLEEFCYDVRKDRVCIFAGGGMSKYNTKLPFFLDDGYSTYLVGIGSLNPMIENSYFDCMTHGLYENAAKIVSVIEKPFFEVMFKHGWHLSLRTALDGMIVAHGCPGMATWLELGNRKPFPVATIEQEEEIVACFDNALIQWASRRHWLEEGEV